MDFRPGKPFPLSSTVSLRTQMPGFPQGACNSNAFKKKKIRIAKMAITCPTISNNDLIAESQIEPKTFGSSLGLCPEAYFLRKKLFFH